jgi:hypothetical protein
MAWRRSAMVPTDRPEFMTTPGLPRWLLALAADSKLAKVKDIIAWASASNNPRERNYHRQIAIHAKKHT